MLLGGVCKGCHVVAPGVGRSGGMHRRGRRGWSGKCMWCGFIILDSGVACPHSLPTRFADFDRVVVPFDFLLLLSCVSR